MADKLIPVNSRVSVMASQVAYVIAPDYKDTSKFICLMAVLNIWSTPCVRPLERQDRFEQAVNDALKGNKSCLFPPL
jgi:hypothetical protein